MTDTGSAFITVHIFSFGSSGHQGPLVGLVGRSSLRATDSEGEEEKTCLHTSPIIRVVRVSVSRPLSLTGLAGGCGIGRSGLGPVTQTSGTSICLGHTGGSASGTSPTSALESGISTETVLAVGVWLRHAIHRLGRTIR